MTRKLLALALALTGCAASSEGIAVPAAPSPAHTPVLTAPLALDHELASVDLRASLPDALETPVSPPSAGPDPSRFTLRRGETLAHFARWSGQPVEQVAETSALDLDGLYSVGTEIALVLDPDERARVEARRDAHHRTRAEAYLSSRNAAGTTFYAVRTGDSAWSVALHHHGMPVWLLESLNPSVNLDRLRPGQSLLVPVFNDVVVDAPAELEPTGPM